MTESPYAERIAELANGARAAREQLESASNGMTAGTTVGKEAAAGTTVGEEAAAAAIADRLSEDGTKPTDGEGAALIAARDGLGPVVALYVEARTADEWVWFSETEMDRLHAATSDWLAVYARCHGIDADPDVTVREAAELLLDTHDVTDVAALLTGVHRSGTSGA